MYLLMKKRCNARSQGVGFALSVDDIEWPDHCPILGTPFDYHNSAPRGEAKNRAPTFDRIDNSLGYIPGNVKIISFRANRLKAEMTPAMARRLIEYMEGRI